MNIKGLLFLLNITSLYAFDFRLQKKIIGLGQSYISSVLKSFPKSKIFDSIQVKRIELPVDHFNKSDERTWKMKYFENMRFFKPGGPIFLFINGEGPALNDTVGKNMLMYQLATETNGAMFASEHRFYGNMMDMPLSLTPFNLQYLNSRQALADLATLIKTLKESVEFKKSKVVVIGGSYAGNLAAWMRALYPDLVDMAHASSAPVLAQKNFHQYFKQVAQDFLEYGSPACVDKISKTFKHYQEIIATPDGMKELNICEGINMTIPENQQYFFYQALALFALTAQYGSPEKIKEICTNIEDLHLSKYLLEILSSESKCNNYNFDQFTEKLSFDASGYAWGYQTCTEFGYFQTISDESPFKTTVPVEFYEKMCTAAYSPNINDQTIENAINNTNLIYGGIKPNVSMVLFTNGAMDPWQSLGVRKPLSETVPAKVISGASHYTDIFNINEKDSAPVLEAKQLVINTIKKWLKL